MDDRKEISIVQSTKYQQLSNECLKWIILLIFFYFSFSDENKLLKKNDLESK